ncbi:histidyl-tRNA synthetase [Clostridium cavendishii DSM 21758]|uniref:Histidine--tRNA ligase n=1 Tax=Clostridium cavendishii DSM 21758 TaxID=1121302 RepID=A0A1M6AA72_9CLOT|nr:histidine--tRNA ligase [Clostridium cavendishii]SHI33316.1 histidyl-tRNA synthetase [Clostridium cavendishii DSM 21758]
MEIQAQKGTKDMLPGDAYKWHYVENKLRNLADEYGIREIRTPIFEATELFERGVGETTDVVQKEMYTFKDKGNRSITLKAEGTAPSVRAFIEGSLYADAQPTKLYYFTPVFRYENVQKGRLRQHHQFGVEIFGSEHASVDAEVISLAMRAYEEFGVENLKLTINSIGHPECRAKYNEALKDFLRKNYDDLCPTCKTRFEKNPMRILDCKEKKCKTITEKAPVILDYICEECNNHFQDLQKYLKIMGIKYKVDPKIVRGLDYYSKTVFEIINNDITVCGGGRYDYLISQIGGPEMPAVGFGMGIERLLLTLEQEKIKIPKEDRCDLFICSMGDEARAYSMKLAFELRKFNKKIDIDHMSKSVKAQMKFANKIGAKYTFVIGETELQEKLVKIKRMSDGEQFEADLNNLNELANLLK